MPHLLARAKWDADAVRGDLRADVGDHFGDPGAILVVDGTGDVKKGTHSVGVQRQYTGTAGRIENAQVAVSLTCAARRGHALIDRALYLPELWTEDPERRAAAGVLDEVKFATKPKLATEMITRAVAAGVPAAWVAGDEVYGADPGLRRTVRKHGLGYVLQVAANRRVPNPGQGCCASTSSPRFHPGAGRSGSAGTGSKGERYYSWAWIAILAEDALEDGDTGQHHVLIRPNDITGELAYHRCYSPAPPDAHSICQSGLTA